MSVRLIPHYWPPTGTVQVLWDPKQKQLYFSLNISTYVYDTTVLVRTYVNSVSYVVKSKNIFQGS
jgi:hypothetical protein